MNSMLNSFQGVEHLLEMKLRACEDFLLSTTLLKKALEVEDIAEVDRLLSHREVLCGSIDGLDRRIAQDRQTSSNGQSSESIGEIEKLSINIKKILQKIVFENQACDTAASNRRDFLKKILTNVHQQKEGIRGYSEKTKQIPKFLNLQT